jgi:hypothetical protein
MLRGGSVKSQPVCQGVTAIHVVFTDVDMPFSHDNEDKITTRCAAGKFSLKKPS